MSLYTVIVLQIYSAVSCEQDDNKWINTDKIGGWCVLFIFLQVQVTSQQVGNKQPNPLSRLITTKYFKGRFWTSKKYTFTILKVGLFASLTNPNLCKFSIHFEVKSRHLNEYVAPLATNLPSSNHKWKHSKFLLVFVEVLASTYGGPYAPGPYGPGPLIIWNNFFKSHMLQENIWNAHFSCITFVILP